MKSETFIIFKIFVDNIEEAISFLSSTDVASGVDIDKKRTCISVEAKHIGENYLEDQILEVVKSGKEVVEKFGHKINSAELSLIPYWGNDYATIGMHLNSTTIKILSELREMVGGELTIDLDMYSIRN